MRRVLFTLLTIYLLFTSPVFAQDPTIGQSRINPASPVYFLKAVSETVRLKFAKTSQERGELQMEYAGRRMREANSLVATTRQDLIEPTLIRYLTHLEEAKGLINLKDEVRAEQVTGEVSAHMNVLQSVYGQISHPRARMSVRSTVFRLTQWEQELAERLIILKSPFVGQVGISKLSGCNFLSKEASSSALSPVEKGVFARRAVQCFGGN